jgi:plasmid maintenance system antidote protein VapI
LTLWPWASAEQINEIVHGTRAVSADTALRLARYFGTSDRFWLNLQSRYDLEIERDHLGAKLEKEVRVLDPAGYRTDRAATHRLVNRRTVGT